MSDNITITFPDGNTKSAEKGISGFELANQYLNLLPKSQSQSKLMGKFVTFH